MKPTKKKKVMPKGRPFQKGVSGNPLGGAIVNPEVRALKRLTQDELIEVGSLVVKGSIKELQAIAKDQNASALKCMIAAVAVRTIQKGDPTALDALLNRLIGKVKDHVEVTGSGVTPRVTITLPSNGREISAPKIGVPSGSEDKKDGG